MGKGGGRRVKDKGKRMKKEGRVKRWRQRKEKHADTGSS